MIARNFYTEDLRIKQADFEGERQNFKKEIGKLENRRRDFLKRFPESGIKNLRLDEYAIGTENSKESFCYRMEVELKGLGNFHGATAFKFGIYYGKTKSDSAEKYRFNPRWGKSQEEAFENVKDAIVALLDAAKEENIDLIKKNRLSAMFKGKILSTYYPDRFLNIFAKEHLEYFLDVLGINYQNTDDEIDERQVLVTFKNSDEVMSEWTIYEFSHFLYVEIGRPAKKENTPEALRPYIDYKDDYPELSAVRADFIELTVYPHNFTAAADRTSMPHGIIDFEKENRRHALLGKRGENIVFDIEREYFEKQGKHAVAQKINWASKEDSSLGYDILSFDDEGKEKYIEVKATARTVSPNVTFRLSRNEYEQAKTLVNYYFYIVFNAKSKNPKIWRSKNLFDYENKGLVLIPESFKVVVSTQP